LIDKNEKNVKKPGNLKKMRPAKQSSGLKLDNRMTAPWIFCAICEAWRWCPNVPPDAILYCRTCDGCLGAPPNMRLRVQEKSVASGSHSLPRADDTGNQVGFVSLPAQMPDLTTLGALLELHQTVKTPFGVIVLAILGVVIAVALTAFAVYIDDHRIGRLVVAGICSLVFLLMAIYAYIRTRIAAQTILLFENGLVRVRFGRVRVFAWDDIVAVYFGSEIRVQHRDRSIISFGDLAPSKPRRAELYAQQELKLRLLPDIMERYRAGECVEFGELGISQAGLFKRGKLLRWCDIGRLYIDIHQKLCVVRSGSFLRWYSQAVMRIPNYFILQELIENHFQIEVQVMSG